MDDVWVASITKQKTGWRVQISVKGQRDSGVYPTKAESQAWAIEREAQMRRMAATGINTDKTCLDAFERYAEEVSPHKRGAAWERQRLTTIAGHKVDGKHLGDMKLCDITVDTLGKWRDMRLNVDQVSGSTINRDMALLSHVFNTARKEWKWLAESPTTDVRRPANPPPRDRRITQDEIDKICLALGYAGEVRTKSDRVAVAFLLAIETAMRAGELCGLQWDDISGKVAHLPFTKNGSKRDVPLSRRAVELLDSLPRDGDACLGLTSAQLDALFRKARDRAAIDGLNFHDTRHEAITRLSKKLNVLELARMSGHRDLKMLQIYYNESAAAIASRLD